jgi:hypothetical protein
MTFNSSVSGAQFVLMCFSPSMCIHSEGLAVLDTLDQFFRDIFMPPFDPNLWAKGKTQIIIDKRLPFLETYTNTNDAKIVIHGFQYGFTVVMQVREFLETVKIQNQSLIILTLQNKNKV